MLTLVPIVTWCVPSITSSEHLSTDSRCSLVKVFVEYKRIRAKVRSGDFSLCLVRLLISLFTAAFLSSWNDYLSFESHLFTYEAGYWFAAKWLRLLIWLGFMPEEITMEGMSFA